MSKLVYLNLMTSPESNTFGLYRAGADLIAFSCGLPVEDVERELTAMQIAGLVRYDADHEIVWVAGLIDIIIGEELKSGDNRRLALVSLLKYLPECEIKFAYMERYIAKYSLEMEGGAKGVERVSEGGSEGVGSKEQEHEKEKDHKKDHEGSPSSASDTSSSSNVDLIREGGGTRKNSRGTRMFVEWDLPTTWMNWALIASKGKWTEHKAMMVAAKFRDHWLSKAGAAGVKADWQATWRNWVREELAREELGGTRRTR